MVKRHEAYLFPADTMCVKAADFDALEADLAEARSDRQREHELRVRYAGVTETQAERIRRLEAMPDERDARIAQLEAALRYIGKACDLSDDETDVGIVYRACFPLETFAKHPDYGTPNWCPVCSPKNLGYCRCEIASNE